MIIDGLWNKENQISSLRNLIDTWMKSSIHFVYWVFACWVAVREELPRGEDESHTAFVPPLDFWTSRWIKSKYFLWGRRDRMESTLLLRGFSPREAVKEDLKITLDFEKYVELSIIFLAYFFTRFSRFGIWIWLIFQHALLCLSK